MKSLKVNRQFTEKNSRSRPWRGMSTNQPAPLAFLFKSEFKLEVGTHTQKYATEENRKNVGKNMEKHTTNFQLIR